MSRKKEPLSAGYCLLLLLLFLLCSWIHALVSPRGGIPTLLRARHPNTQTSSRMKNAVSGSRLRGAVAAGWPSQSWAQLSACLPSLPPSFFHSLLLGWNLSRALPLAQWPGHMTEGLKPQTLNLCLQEWATHEEEEEADRKQQRPARRRCTAGR